MDKFTFFNGGKPPPGTNEFKFPEPKSPFVKTYKVAFKEHKTIQDFYNKHSNSPHDVFDGMNQEPLERKKEGKRLFMSISNKSDKKDLYPASTDPDVTRELFHRRVTSDFSNKHNVKYIPPPVVKDILKKNTFVHNCLANKSKNNVEHFENIYNKKVLNQRKRQIVAMLHESSIDFRMLQAFKNALFDADELEDNHLISVATYKEIAKYEMNN